MTGEVLAIGDWHDNAEMIRDAVMPMGWLDGKVLDLTYGHGRFWSKHRPEQLVTNDLHPDKGDHTVSYLAGPPPGDWVRRFDAVVLDVPYAMTGRRDRGMFDEQYGLDQLIDWEVPHHLIGGLNFAIWCRSVPSGVVLVKCQDQQWSGKLYEQTDIVRQVGQAHRLRVAARFHLRHTPRAQPPGRAQKSERSNYSTLMVLAR